MLEALVIALLLLCVLRSVMRSMMPGVYVLGLRLLQWIPSLFLWVILGTSTLSSTADRRRQKGAQRFVSKRSKRR